MNSIPETLLHTIAHYKVLPRGSVVIAAVSGGADSIALLHALAGFATSRGIVVHTATLNHGLRPEAAQETAFVTQFAAELGFITTAGVVDGYELAARWGIGLEAAARRARYEFLAQTAYQQGADTIITAHHADDQAETMLLHVLRGSGTDGLKGMAILSPLPGDPHLQLLRPLLAIPRAAIEAYCRQYHLPFVQDASNDDRTFLRNRIRHELMPMLEQVNPRIREALLNLGQAAALDSDYLQAVVTDLMRQHTRQIEGRIRIDRVALGTWHKALRQRVLLQAVRELGGEPGWNHIIHAVGMIERGEVGAAAQFPGRVRLRVDYAYLWVEREADELPSGDYLLLDQPMILPVPGEIQLKNGVIQVSLETLPDAVRIAVPADGVMWLRGRLPGDRFQPAGMGGHSCKLKDWFIDHKIPAYLRDQIPLLVHEGRILAILLPDRWVIAQSLTRIVISQHYIYFSVRKL